MTAKQESQAQKAEIRDRKSPSGMIVYASILAEAKDELERRSMALFWSGLAAGLSMGFSVLGVALLQAYLPDAPWQQLVSRFGYSLGFLVVILGRQQLFTENTLTPILPLMRQRDVKTFLNVSRLWGVTLLANLLGAWIVAFLLARTSALEPPVHASLLLFAANSFQGSFGLVILRGVFAGWLIALIVWLLPFAEVARIWVIIILTYIVALGNFPHIIAGAVEVFSLAWVGAQSWPHVLLGYLLPTLIGNIIGGVTLVAALNHAQVLSGAKDGHIKATADTGLP